MLSSLGGQDVTVNVAHMPGNGTPTTEEAIAAHRKRGLDVRSCVFDDYVSFQYRGLTRNRQIRECDTRWILFSDTDMVYAPDYFAKLLEQISRRYHGMYIAGRFSNPAEYAEYMVATWAAGHTGCVVPFAWDIASSIEKIPRRNVGAGYFQLVQVRDTGGYYVTPDDNRDHGWTDTYSKCRSDQQFRHRIGHTRKLPRWFSENEIHLNHARDNEAGTHLEEQR